jgi:two-component system, LytTR family, sensor kinase
MYYIFIQLAFFYICPVNKKLYKTALLSSPILALYGTVPIFVFNKVDIPYFLLIWFSLCVLIFIFWTINIVILSKIKKIDSLKRYVLSYGITILLQGLNVPIIHQLNIKTSFFISILPLIGGVIAINTIILILANFIVLQFQKEHAEAEIQQLKVSNLEAQKHLLIQQLHPHFLFNALSTLKSLIKENPEGAEDYSVKLSEFLRYSIQAQSSELVNLEEELQFTRDYIELQKVRFGDAFHCEIDIPNTYLSLKLPTFALQTLVENAIKHNRFTDKKPLFISIKIENDKIKVSNNKTKKALIQPSGTGLKNLNERYELAANQSVVIKDDETQFTVFLNLIDK